MVSGRAARFFGLCLHYKRFAAEGQERKTQKLHKKRAKWQNSSFKIVYPAL
jgi:hypothetical protein